MHFKGLRYGISLIGRENASMGLKKAKVKEVIMNEIIETIVPCAIVIFGIVTVLCIAIFISKEFIGLFIKFVLVILDKLKRWD